MSQHWALEMKTELQNLKSYTKVRAWADLIFHLFTKTDQDKIIELLQNPNKQVRLEIHILVTEKPPTTEGE